MSQQNMFPAKSNSPETELASAITAADTSMTLKDASVLPPAPNVCTIGSDEGSEVVKYTSISGNVISGLIRGFSGTTASAWDADTPVSREYTSYDHDTFIGNIDDLNTVKADNSILGDAFSTSSAYAIGDYVIYQGALYRFTSAHTAGAWDSSEVTQVVAMEELADLQALVESRQKFYVSGTASAGSSFTITDARINSEHWRVPKNGIYFGTPGNVTTGVHWVTNVANHTVTLEATFAGATTVEIDLEWYQNVQA